MMMMTIASRSSLAHCPSSPLLSLLRSCWCFTVRVTGIVIMLSVSLTVRLLVCLFVCLRAHLLLRHRILSAPISVFNKTLHQYWMGDRLGADKPFRYATSHLGRL